MCVLVSVYCARIHFFQCCTTNARVSKQNRIHGISFIHNVLVFVLFSDFSFLGLTKSLCVTTLFGNKQKTVSENCWQFNI